MHALRTILKFLAVACLVMAVGALGLSIPPYWQQYRILKTWPAVEATVSDRRVARLTDNAGGSLYAAQLAFSYTVQGRDYTGLYEFPHLSTHSERKQQQLAGFPKGSVHQIRYNPSRPGDIRIQVGYNVHYFVIPVFITGVGLIFAVLAAVLYALSRLPRRRAG